MSMLFSTWALAYISFLLLMSGSAHATAISSFCRTIISQGRFRSRIAAWAATLSVTIFELGAGAGAVWCLLTDSRLLTEWILLAVTIGGSGFAVYTNQLLKGPERPAECGCSPLRARLTRASLTPSIGLILVSIAGMCALSVGSMHSTTSPAFERVLASLWGITLSGLTIVYPAVVLEL